MRRRLTPATWLLLAVSVAYGACTAVLQHQAYLEPIDFPAFYTGWSIVRDGRAQELYDLDVQAAYQQRILARPLGTKGVLPYVHPPYAVFPFLPLALLSIRQAAVVFLIVQFVILGWILFTLVEIGKPLEPDERIVMLAAVTAFPMVWVTIYKGQFGLFVLLCLLRFYRALRSGNDRPAGGWVLGMAIKPHLMLLPTLLLMATRRTRALVIVLGGALLLVIGALAAFGTLVWQRYVVLVHDAGIGRVPWIAARYMFNLRGALASWRHISPQAVNTASDVALLAAALFTMTFWWRVPSARDERFDGLWALTMVLAIVLSPHLFYYDTVLLIAPAVVAYVWLRRRGSISKRWGAYLVVFGPALTFEQMLVTWHAHAVRPLFIAMLLAAAALVWLLRRPVADGT